MATPTTKPTVQTAAPTPAPAAASPAATYTISALAREFDITPRAIRFYEDQGILSPSRAGRNRVYAARDRARLKLLLRGKRLGLSLSEVRSLIDMYDSPRDTEAQLREFLAVLARHRATLERQREDIGLTLAEISAHETQCHALLVGHEGQSQKDLSKKVSAKKAAKPDASVDTLAASTQPPVPPVKRPRSRAAIVQE